MAYSSIIKPSDYFNTKLYTGTDNSNAITGVGFQPDFTWLKKRSSTASHALQDAVRGNDKTVRSNSYNAQYTNSFFSSFNSDGFTVATSESDVNTSGSTYTSWNWKANGQGSANTSGSINTTYTSANTTSGFSICKWIGTQSVGTVAHGLGTVPKMYFVKNLDSTDSWNVFANTGYMDANYRLLLDTTGGRISDSDAWNSQNPTSSFFTVGTNTGTNKSGSNMIAYIFSEIKGFSKISEYRGNGNADGSFIFCGFKPAWILFKKTNGSGDNWFIFDNKRAGYNVDNDYLHPDTTGAEGTSNYLDIVSNGFKLRTSGSDLNGDGDIYTYLAFAENPFVANAGESLPTTAR